MAALREHDRKMVWELYCDTNTGFGRACVICSAPPPCQCFQSDCRPELELRFTSCLWWPLSAQANFAIGCRALHAKLGSDLAVGGAGGAVEQRGAAAAVHCCTCCSRERSRGDTHVAD
eukprot:1290337-Rhodomonas_salina.6